MGIYTYTNIGWELCWYLVSCSVSLSNGQFSSQEELVICQLRHTVLIASRCPFQLCRPNLQSGGSLSNSPSDAPHV